LRVEISRFRATSQHALHHYVARLVAHLYRGFGVQGSGFRDEGLEYRVECIGLRIQGIAYRVWVNGLGFKGYGSVFGVGRVGVWGLGFRV